MVKTQTKLLGVAALASVLMAASCGDDEKNPVAPSATAGAIQPGAAIPGTAGSPGGAALLAIDINTALPGDGVIALKVPAPGLSSPANNATIAGLDEDLIINNPIPRNVNPGDAPLTYEFEVYVVEGAAMTRVAHANNVAAGSGTTTYRVQGLEQTKTFMWRARAKIGNEAGPWSQPYTFMTPTLVIVATPTPLSPANGADVSTSRPDLVVQNPEVSANAGAVQIDFQIDDDPNLASPSTFSVAMGAGGTTTGRFPDALAANRTFGWRVRASANPPGGSAVAARATATTGRDAVIVSDWSEIFTFNTTSGGPRTPDPPPGGMLPLPNLEPLVFQLAAMHPAELADSCQEDGGTWEFMDLAFEAFRMTDTRWGWNCKRGNCGDISLDVLAYHYGAGPSEGSTEVYIIDIIGGHCGPGPSPAWIDQTDATAANGDVGRWSSTR